MGAINFYSTFALICLLKYLGAEKNLSGQTIADALSWSIDEVSQTN